MSKFRSACGLMFALTLSLVSACHGAPTPSADAPPVVGPGAVVKITADDQGFHPANFKAPAARPVRLEFTRTSEQTCATAVVFPALKIRRDLPLDKPVAIDITMPASGSIAFVCGMDMFKGSIVAE